MKNVYKFVKWDVPELDTLSDTFAYKMMTKLNNGETLTRDDKNDLACAFSEYNGMIKRKGYCFNFIPYTKRFVVNTQYYGWREVNAFDKTTARLLCKFCGKIEKILEVR